MLFEIPKILAKSKCHYDRRGYLQEIYLRKDQKQNFKFSILTSSKKNVFRGVYLKKHFPRGIYIITSGNMLKKKSRTPLWCRFWNPHIYFGNRKLHKISQQNYPTSIPRNLFGEIKLNNSIKAA